ncbi:MAG: hypothetical protein NC548_34850 [Lachnospiraceae bacterium]|nr:hypothetical protein [Lachnospiraceae bacterium]
MDIVKRKITFSELVNDLPNTILHELYYRNYLEVMRREKEAKAKAAAEAAQKNSGGHSIITGDEFEDEEELVEQLEEMM